MAHKTVERWIDMLERLVAEAAINGPLAYLHAKFQAVPALQVIETV